MPTTAPTLDLDALLARARAAQAALPDGPRTDALRAIAEALRADAPRILEANARDVQAQRREGTPAPLLDRLALDEARLAAIAVACEQVAALPDPLHRVVRGWRSDDDLDIREVTAPFGVIAVVYESRPNVTVDAAALTLAAGSAAVLRGSASALASNRALAAAMRRGLAAAGLPEDAVQLIDSPERRYVTDLLAARGRVDLAIPRGGASLIAHVVETAKVPVIETGVGNCHVYVHEDADLAMAEEIVVNAKTQRPGVCNAAETLLVDAAVAPTFLPAAARRLHEAGVELRGDERARAAADMAPATEADWAEEYLDLILAVRVVDGLDEATGHIARYGSGHSEAIVTASREAARRFQARVDAAAVYVNASTRFTDGFVFGFGAEIGISTQKLHARGPMGLEHLVTRRYLVDGGGQVRR
jgi:glutamate-5-semialdehyde dehydrogenase